MGKKNKYGDGKKTGGDGGAAGDAAATGGQAQTPQQPQQQQQQQRPSQPHQQQQEQAGPSNTGNVPGGQKGKKKQDKQQQGQQRGPQEKSQPQQGQSGPQQQQQRVPQQQQPEKQPQHGSQQQQPQGQRGAPQQQQPQGAWGGQQQQPQVQRGPPQQGQRGPPQQGQRGPPQQQSQGAWGGQQQQPQGQRGAPQQQQPQGARGGQQQQPQGQRGPPQQGQRGPPQQSQRGPPQQQSQGAWGGQQQQGQRGGPQQQPQRGPQQQQQGQRAPQQQQQGQRAPQQQNPAQRDPQQQQFAQQQQREPSVSSTSSSLSLQSASSKGSIPRGTLGRKGVVEVNYLDINMDNMPDFGYHYDVEITPERPKKFMRPAFDQFCRQFFPNIQIAFDGKKSCYTAQRLPVNALEQEVEIEDTGARRISYKVSIKETQDMEVDLKSLKSYHTERVYDKPMRALQLLEVVLASPCHNKGVRVGRSFYTQPREKYDLNGGYEMWTGLYQAAILGDLPFLNVDISHKSFPSECYLTDYIEKNIRNSDLRQPLTDYNKRDLSDFLKSISIVYEPPKSFGQAAKTFKVNDITAEPANRLSFTMEDGTKKTVAEYYASKNYRLRYPNLNCLHVGSTVKTIYVPIELCKVPAGQATNKKDGEEQVRAMIKYAATSTNVRKDKIMKLLQYFDHNRDIRLVNFGIKIGNAFKQVQMRILDSPLLEYFSSETIRPRGGSWRMNDSTKFLFTNNPNNGHKWAVLFSGRSRINYSALDKFAKMVLDLSKKVNMNLSSKYDILKFENIANSLQDCKRQNYDLVFVALPFRGASYADVKQNAELRIGQLTQCIKENTIERRCDPQTILNILLKVNGKLNGTNHKIDSNRNMPLKNVMFLGADVTHPSPDQKHIPSVVGVAASHDANGACYNMQYRLQKSTVENIEDMDSIFTHHMKVYFENQKKYPEHIIYYRDGVSDGQFPIVKRNELRAIRSACERLRCRPKLTCIIVIKRHHTRFFPTTVNQRDRFNNVEPGTVVDQVIVHPNEVQFFMVSHQSIQGTAKPTRYNVIEDDAKMNIDELQKLTYNLCHMFPRCNRVVSYPAPAYLAHLVAFRGRVYIEGTYKFDEPKREYEKRLIKPEFMKLNPMYFI